MHGISNGWCLSSQRKTQIKDWDRVAKGNDPWLSMKKKLISLSICLGTVPVKSPAASKVFYKKTLLTIVRDTEAVFVLGQKEFFEELLKCPEERPSNYLSSLMASSSAEWLYQADQQVCRMKEERGGGGGTGGNGEETRKGLATVEEEPEQAATLKNGEEERKIMERLDKTQPQDMAFLLYANTGEKINRAR